MALVSVVQYPGVSHEMTMVMAFGDVFELEQVKSFALADFAQRCGIAPSLLKREAIRLAKLAQAQAQAARLMQLAADAARIKSDYL